MNSTVKTLVLWVVLIVTGVLLWQVVQRTQSGAEKEKDFSEILNEIEKSNVASVEIIGSEVKGKFKDGSAFKTTMPNYPEFFKTLIAKGVIFKVKEPAQSPWLTALISWAPFVLLIGESRQAAVLPAEESYFQGCCWSRGSERGIAGDH